MSTALYRPYCTLIDVQKETRNNDSVQADWFKECINRASRAIEEHCRRDFWLHDHSASALTVKDEWIVGNSIVLPWPILTLTAVVEDSITLDSDDYLAEGKTIYREGEWLRADHKRYITLTGTFGQTLEATDPETKPPTDLPSEVRRACTLLASAWTMFNRRELVGYEGNKETLLDSRVPKEVGMLLGKYRIRFL